MELPAGFETGIYEDIGEYITVSPSALAGGLFTHSNLLSGSWTIGGLVQNEWLWGIGSASCPWLFIEPTNGTLAPGMTEDMTVHIESTGLLPGIYEADIIFITNPVTDPEIVLIILTVEGLTPPINFTGYYDCTDICLGWEIPSGYYPDYFNIYRDGMLIDTTTGYGFCDSLLMPEVEYCYQIIAVYESGESMPTPEFCISVPTPADLEPYDLEAIIHYPDEYDVTLLWEEPTACLSPDGYNIFRNDEQINSTLVIEPTYIDPDLPGNFYEYYVTAVYYFGESIPSDPTYALFYDIDEFNFEICRIYPNPSEGLLNIESGYPIRLVQIFDIHGKFLFDKIINSKKSRIDISFFEPGIYFLKIQTKNAIFNQKIILQ